MKVLQVISSFYPAFSYGGPVKVAFDLSKKLVEKGHEVTVYTTDTYNAHSRTKDYKNHEIIEGIEIFRFKNISNRLAHMNFPFAPGMALALRKGIEKFDIIHLHEYRSSQAIFVHSYAVKRQVPYVLQAHGALSFFYQKKGLKKAYDNFSGNQLLRDASRVIALTNSESYQCKSMGVTQSKIEIVPNGIDLSEFNNLPEKGEFCKEHPIPTGENVILFLGRIHSIKGIDLLIDAFSELIKELDNVTLVLVGPNDGYLQNLQNKIHQLNLTDKVLIVGPIYGREKLKAFVDADVYVLPSIYETFPMTILEAFACGTPVVTTESCGIADIILNNHAGLVSRYDKNELKECISKIILCDELKDNLSNNGKRLVNHDLNLERCTDLICKIYAKTLEGW